MLAIYQGRTGGQLREAALAVGDDDNGRNTAPAGNSQSPESDIYIDRVHIRNFRTLGEVVLLLNPGVTYLVGENNAGKSSALLAIATACGTRRATTDDLRQDAAGRSARTTEIDLILRPSADEFIVPVGQRFEGNYGSGPGPGEWIGIRTSLQQSRETSFLTGERTYLSWDASRRTWIDTGRFVREQAQELLTAHIIGASRDLTDDLTARGSDWGRVLADLGFTENDREALQSELLLLGRKLQGASPVLDKLAKSLSDLSAAQTGVQDIELRPLPPQLEELGRSVDIVVSSPGRPELPLRFQGLGMRSLASLMVFRVLSEVRLGADRGIKPLIVTLLEEPEAHLHPQAQAAVREIIEALPGQAVVATHSDVLVSECHPQAIRIFRTSPAGPTIHSLGIEGAKKVAVFRRYVERPLGELFFARMVVFVDGTAERISLPVMLQPLLGTHCAGAGVTLIDLEGMTKEQLTKAVEALSAVGEVPWLVFLDNDASGWDAIDDVKGSDGVPLSSSHAQVVVAGNQQLEALLMESGYADEVHEVANTYLPRTPEDPLYPGSRLESLSAGGSEADHLAFLSANKGWAGELVARRAVKNGKAMPPSVIELGARIRSELSLSEPADIPYQKAAGLYQEDADNG